MPRGSPTPNTLRHYARRRLGAVCEGGGWLCHWCGCPLMTPARAARQGTVLRVSNKTVRWVDGGGKEHCDRLATADHLTPIRDGGTSHAGNLVPSCGPCNNARGALPPSYDHSRCRKCGGAKEDRTRRCCRACRRGDPGRARA